MDPERLARTTVSVCFAGMAGAIFGAIAGFLACVVFSAWEPAVLVVPLLFVAGGVGGAALGRRWAATMPLRPKADDQEADYTD